MALPTHRFPDAQRVLVDALQPLIVDWMELTDDDRHVGIETPTNLDTVVPFVRVTVIGGTRDRLNASHRVDIDVFASTYQTSYDLADYIFEWLTGPPPGPTVFDRVDCDATPHEEPWGDNVRRFGATYQLVYRRRLAA